MCRGMAKNTGASKFRKVDVDQYDDNKFFEETEADADADSNGVNIQEVTDLLLQYPFLLLILYLNNYYHCIIVCLYCPNGFKVLFFLL